jgi:hypothetical protein
MVFPCVRIRFEGALPAVDPTSAVVWSQPITHSAPDDGAHDLSMMLFHGRAPGIMTLHFPNQSRNYNQARDCVSFWGHEAAFEVAFQIETKALRRMSPQASDDEASLLEAFDRNRARIQQIASVAYSRSRKSYLRLSATDF